MKTHHFGTFQLKTNNLGDTGFSLDNNDVKSLWAGPFIDSICGMLPALDFGNHPSNAYHTFMIILFVFIFFTWWTAIWNHCWAAASGHHLDLRLVWTLTKPSSATVTEALMLMSADLKQESRSKRRA